MQQLRSAGIISAGERERQVGARESTAIVVQHAKNTRVSVS